MSTDEIGERAFTNGMVLHELSPHALLVEVNDGMIAAERRYIAAVLDPDHQLPSLPAAPRN